jgi:hypothetical protein
MGWGYRLIEAGGVITAVALLLAPLVPPPFRSARPAWSELTRWLGWAAGPLLGTVPFLAYVASRSVGMPGDPRDVGNWGDWVGTVSLLVEAALVTLSVSMLALRQARRQPAARPGRGEFREYARQSDSAGRYATTSPSRGVRCGATTQPSSVPSCPGPEPDRPVARRRDEPADDAVEPLVFGREIGSRPVIVTPGALSTAGADAGGVPCRISKTAPDQAKCRLG